MTVETSVQLTLKILQEKATRLRIDSVLATTEAGSGHPTSCASAAEIMSVLFYSAMRYDPHDPRNPDSDIFVLSKGHAAPILYAAWAEAGAFPREKLLTLRKIDSDLEGHPTTLLPFVDVATDSPGQGLSCGSTVLQAPRPWRRTPRLHSSDVSSSISPRSGLRSSISRSSSDHSSGWFSSGCSESSFLSGLWSFGIIS
jgi:transketolase N-terminal domain/subunit